MEWLIDLVVRLGFSRDVAVNVVTDLLFAVVFGVVLAGVGNWLRLLSDKKRSSRVLEDAFRSADQCLADYFAAGVVLAKIPSIEDSSKRADALEKFVSRLQDVQREAARFDRRLGRVSAGLSRQVHDEVVQLSRGLDKLVQHAADLERGIANLSQTPAPASQRRSFSKEQSVWMDALELAAEFTRCRAKALTEKRAAVSRKFAVNLVVLKPETGRLQTKWDSKGPSLAELARATWGKGGMDRPALSALLIKAVVGF
jgi:hypothetical protein